MELADETLLKIKQALIEHYGSENEIPDGLKVELRYEGGGDSGGIEDITLSSNDGDVSYSVLNASVKGMDYHLDRLEDIFEVLLDQILSRRGLYGWELNDGSEGTMIISLKDCKLLSLEHTNFYREYTHYDSED